MVLSICIYPQNRVILPDAWYITRFASGLAPIFLWYIVSPVFLWSNGRYSRLVPIFLVPLSFINVSNVLICQFFNYSSHLFFLTIKDSKEQKTIPISVITTVVPSSVGTNPVLCSKWLIFNKLVSILKVPPHSSLQSSILA